MNTNKSVTASFLRLRTLSITVQGSGSVTLSPGGGGCSGGTTCGFTYLDGTIVAATPTPGASFAFGQWSGDCTGSGACSVTMTQDRAVTATFDPYVVVSRTGPGLVTSEPAGISCGLACTAPFVLGTTVTLTATPDPGYLFQGWSGDCTGTGTCTLTATAPHTVAARFGPWLSATTVGHGTITSAPSVITVGSDSSVSNPVVVGTAVTLTATPDPNWQFMGWSGDCTGTADCSLVVDADRSATATFVRLYTLTVNVVGSGGNVNNVVTYPGGNSCTGTCAYIFTDGTAVTLVANMSGTGWAFTGWSGACTTTDPTCLLTLDGDKTVTGTFKPLYTLTITTQGSGEVSPDSPLGPGCRISCTYTYVQDTVVTLTPGPDVGWNFGAWSGACTGNGSCAITITGNLAVDARFDPVINLSHAGNGWVTSSPPGLECRGTCARSFPLNSTVTLHASPDVGYAFTGWSGACTGTGDCVLIMDGTKSVGVTIVPIHQIILSTGAGGTVTGDPALPGLCGQENVWCSYWLPEGTVLTLTATPNPGLAFVGWTGDCSGTGTCILTVDADKNLTATFGYMLTVSQAQGGFINQGTITSSPPGLNCRETCSAPFAIGSTVTLTAAPDLDYQFDGWSGDCTGTGPCSVLMNADRSVNATFSLKPHHDLVVTKVGSGFVQDVPEPTTGRTFIYCGNICTASVPEGIAVTLNATPDTNFVFSGWSGDCTGMGSCTVTMDGPRSVTATFTPLYTLTLTTNPLNAGSIQGSPGNVDCSSCAPQYVAGTTVTLAATPDYRHTFSGWSGACSGTGTCTVMMDADKSVTANFTALPTNTLTVSVVGSGEVISTPGGIFCPSPSNCTATFPVGYTVTLTAYPSVPSLIAVWTGCTPTGARTCSVTLDTDRSVSVTFAPPRTLTVNMTTGLGSAVSSPPGISCPPTCSAPFAENSTVEVTATAAPGYAFSSWTVFGTTVFQNPLFVFMDADAVATPSFVPVPPNTLTVTGIGSGRVTSNPPGIDCRSTTCSAQFANRSTVQLTATPDPGYYFHRWLAGVCMELGNPCSVYLDADKATSAEFLPMKVLTVTLTNPTYNNGTITSSPPGINCGSSGGPCTALFAPGDVQLTATPDTNAYFYGWSGACSGSVPTCTVSMATNQSVGFQFFPKSKLTVTVTGSGSVSVSPPGSSCTGTCEYYYTPDVTVTLTAVPNAGATFLGWGGDCSGIVDTCGKLMLGDRTVSAGFSP